jgi:hypothetical protein
LGPERSRGRLCLAIESRKREKYGEPDHEGQGSSHPRWAGERRSTWGRGAAMLQSACEAMFSSRSDPAGFRASMSGAARAAAWRMLFAALFAAFCGSRMADQGTWHCLFLLVCLILPVAAKFPDGKHQRVVEATLSVVSIGVLLSLFMPEPRRPYRKGLIQTGAIALLVMGSGSSATAVTGSH